MNREIKFRAWDENQQAMAYQGFPDLETIQSFFFHYGDKTLMQFTGLTDKNGKEIYEGDLLLDKEFTEDDFDISGKYPVVYDVNQCCFCVDNSFKKDGSSLVNIIDYFGVENLEVIGNVYENSELLNPSNK